MIGAQGLAVLLLYNRPSSGEAPSVRRTAFRLQRTLMTDAAETQTYRTPFWRNFPLYAMVTPSAVVVSALQKAGKTMCENYATLYSTIYDALMAKAESSESLVACLQKLRDLDAPTAELMTEQLEQCALLRSALAADIRQDLAAPDRERFFDSAATAFNNWTIQERKLPEPVDNILQFVIELLTALYDVPPDDLESVVKKDPTLDEETQTLLALALRTYLFDDDVDEDFYEDDAPGLERQTPSSSGLSNPETPLTNPLQGTFMSATDENFYSSFWDGIDDAELVTSRAVIPAVTKAGKSLRQNFAALHDTLYGALIKKAGSPEAVVSHAKALHDLDDHSTDYLRKQLAQCALICDVLKSDARQAAKQYVWDAFLDYAADNFNRWAAGNSLADPANAILQFDVEVLAALYECIPSCVETAVKDDEAISKDDKKALISALSVYDDVDYDDYDDDYEEDEDDEFDDYADIGEFPAFSSSAWPTLYEALSPMDRAVFKIAFTPLIIFTLSWAIQELKDNDHFDSVLSKHCEHCVAFSNLMLSVPMEEADADEKLLLETATNSPERTQEEKVEELCQTGVQIAKAINRLSEADYNLFKTLLNNTSQFVRLIMQTLTEQEMESIAQDARVSYDSLPTGIVLTRAILQGLHDFPRRAFVGELSAAD